jgi:cytochrome c oxidase subunit 2
VVEEMKVTRILLIVLLCGGIVALWGCPAEESADMPEQVPPEEATVQPDDEGAADHEPGEHMDEEHAPGEHMHGDHMDGSNPSDASLSGEVVDGTRVVEVEAKRYEFVPSPIVVEAGEPVKLEVTATDTAHGIGLEDFGIDERLPQGETRTVEFTPQEAGEYHIHCTVYCGPGHEDMHGTLIVKE